MKIFRNIITWIMTRANRFSIAGFFSFFVLFALFNYIFYQVSSEKHKGISGAENALGQAFFFFACVFFYLLIVISSYIIVRLISRKQKTTGYLQGIVYGYHFLVMALIACYLISATLRLFGESGGVGWGT